MAERNGGSLLISTSARTPQVATSIFEQLVTVPRDLYRWKSGDEANPYFAILALSDELIVTADSISMLSEACATGKPVYMADLGGYGYPMRPDRNTPVDFRLTALTYSWMMRMGPMRLSRDIRLVHDRLISEGRVVWLGEQFDTLPVATTEDLQHAVQRVKGLFE